MARPLRIDSEDASYHGTGRGWQRRAIVRADRDRQRWFELLECIVTRCGWRVFDAELYVSRRHGNHARSAAISLAHRVTDAAVGVIGEYFGGVSMAALSKTVARAEHRRRGDCAWPGYRNACRQPEPSKKS